MGDSNKLRSRKHAGKREMLDKAPVNLLIGA